MNRIELDHWYLKDNNMAIALLKFHVKIDIKKNNKEIYYQTNIKGEDKNITVNFYTIEDAISFTEKVVANCKDTGEVANSYKTMYEYGKFKSPYPKKNKGEELSL